MQDHWKMRQNFKQEAARRAFKFLLGGGVILGIWACAQVDPRQARRPSGYAVRAGETFTTQVTGVACAAAVDVAIREAEKVANFNLRSVIGDTRYVVSFKELRRYEENNQTCVQLMAQARQP